MQGQGVCVCVCARIELHKAISKWLSTHDDDELISILKPFKILQRYLDYMELGVGQDLAILLFLAKNQERCKNVGIANWLKMLNLAVMEELAEGGGAPQASRAEAIQRATVEGRCG